MDKKKVSLIKYPTTNPKIARELNKNLTWAAANQIARNILDRIIKKY